MIEFINNGTELILSYCSDNPSQEWVYQEIERSGDVSVAKVFTFKKDDLVTAFSSDTEDDAVHFRIAIKQGEYFRFRKEVLSLANDLFVHQDIKFDRKIFVSVRNISIFRKIDTLIEGSLYVGGSNDGAIPKDEFLKLIKAFPNTYELNRYASARISAIISSYVDTKDEYEEKYQRYLNKLTSIKGTNLLNIFSNSELLKYEAILEKLKKMLDDEESYSENQWQEELLEIVLLLNPKYIHIFKEAPIRDTYNGTTRKADYLLVDSSGNVDIVEIKKPFDKCIVTQRTYRDNHIPLRELSGTIMQIEKYIFHLNKWGKRGEDKLNEIYQKQISSKLDIKITNPNALIIMGRTKGLSKRQIQDFEIIRRKYKNVIDIVTYDDLIERLQFSINQWGKT